MSRYHGIPQLEGSSVFTPREYRSERTITAWSARRVLDWAETQLDPLEMSKLNPSIPNRAAVGIMRDSISMLADSDPVRRIIAVNLLCVALGTKNKRAAIDLIDSAVVTEGA